MCHYFWLLNIFYIFSSLNILSTPVLRYFNIYWIIDQFLMCSSGIASMPDELSLFIAIATLLIECG